MLCPLAIPPPLTDNDSAATLKQRAAKKLNVTDTSDISALYEWHMVRYALDDGAPAISRFRLTQEVAVIDI
jgi:hypothetical protein